MEINWSCLGTAGKTIASDLCYLRTICNHKRLLFIIIVVFFVFFLLLSYPIFDFLRTVLLFFITLSMSSHALSYIELTLTVSFRQSSGKWKKLLMSCVFKTFIISIFE